MKCILILVILSVLLFFVNCKLDLNDQTLYLNEICSFAGTPTITENNTVICKCYDGYDGKLEKYKILGNSVQCYYTNKKRFTALVLAMALPLGFEFLYLEKYKLAIIEMLITVCAIVNSIIYFVYIKKYEYEKENLSEFRKKANFEASEDEGLLQILHARLYNKREKFFKFYKIILIILLIIGISNWIINATLVGTGFFKDGNGYKTYNDLNFMLKMQKIKDNNS